MIQKYHLVLGQGFEKLLPHMLSPLPPTPHPHPPDVPNTRFGRFLSSRFCFAPPHHDWTWQCLQVQLRVKLWERSVLTLFGAQLYPSKVWMWHLSSRALIFLQICENISTDWCSLEPTADALTQTVCSTCQQPLFLWVVADYHVFLISLIHKPQCILLSLAGIPDEFSKSFSSFSSIIKVNVFFIVIEGFHSNFNL